MKPCSMLAVIGTLTMPKQAKQKRSSTKANVFPCARTMPAQAASFVRGCTSIAHRGAGAGVRFWRESFQLGGVLVETGEKLQHVLQSVFYTRGSLSLGLHSSGKWDT